MGGGIYLGDLTMEINRTHLNNNNLEIPADKKHYWFEYTNNCSRRTDTSNGSGLMIKKKKNYNQSIANNKNGRKKKCEICPYFSDQSTRTFSLLNFFFFFFFVNKLLNVIQFALLFFFSFLCSF